MLWMVDRLTWRACAGGGGGGGPCGSDQDCGEGGSCLVSMDGYVESAACVCLGFLWLLWGRRRLLALQALDMSAWRCRKATV
ncbi:acetyl-coenzyme A transporter 1-like [Pollicipes pollicipes]|nr:acetyl-coenzyme A transporter 1-like [Pollicipes pollicipes]XP_037092698.1 acetyl-coenzyme A transporter 1-like [Pollicipes pollicipes]